LVVNRRQLELGPLEFIGPLAGLCLLALLTARWTLSTPLVLYSLSHWDDDPQAGYAMQRPDGSCPACQTLSAVISSGQVRPRQTHLLRPYKLDPLQHDPTPPDNAPFEVFQFIMNTKTWQYPHFWLPYLSMKFPQLIPGRFLNRDNRFRATVEVAGQEAWAHVPNSGRLHELFTPNRPIWLAPAASAKRKTAYDLKLVEYASVLVSVDARSPNPLFAEALAAGRIAGFPYPDVRPEVQYGDSRFDFRLSGPQGTCWVESKSVTLVEDGLAQFPDAPTIRGRKHLRGLRAARLAGDQAAVIFVIQRPDARRFAPYQETDPEFTDALIQAAAAGVAVRAFTCQVSHTEITIAAEIPVTLT